MTLPAADPVQLAAVMGRPADHLVVVDFDGTLAEIVDRPDDAALAPGALQALRRLARATTVAICSGRDVEDLRKRTIGAEAILVGGHGAHIVAGDATLVELVDVDAVVHTLDAVEGDVRTLLEDRPGWLIERKPTSLAVHHRLVPVDDETARLPALRSLLARRLGDAPGFQLLDGKSVVELRPEGIDKGRAVEWLLRYVPGSLPLVIGDDVTDEDAFAVARRHNGTAILVAEVERRSLASDRLRDPTAVVAFLRALGANAHTEDH